MSGFSEKVGEVSGVGHQKWHPREFYAALTNGNDGEDRPPGMWRQALILVKPDTVISWHRAGHRRLWRWRSGSVAKTNGVAKVGRVRRNRPAVFKGRHFQDEVIVLCVRWYLRYSLSYRDLEELMTKRGLRIDHSTIARWVLRYAPILNQRMRPHVRHLELTRSRAYKKNDQAWIEQKNGAIIRKLVGHGRLEGADATLVLADLHKIARGSVTFSV